MCIAAFGDRPQITFARVRIITSVYMEKQGTQG